jgi:uncharacterized protein involved in exopolysaccharide biosynthesis
VALTRLSSARDFFRVWFYWKKHAILAFFIIVGIIMGFGYLVTPLYETHAKILILPRTGEGTVISAGREETRITQVSQQDINTEIELLTSAEVMQDTVSSFLSEGKGLALRVKKTKWHERAIEKLKQIIGKILIALKLKDKVSNFDAKVALLSDSLEVEPVALSNIILVTLEAENPKVAAIVLDRLLDIYIQHHSRVYTKDEGAEFYGDQAQRFQEKLQAAEKRLGEFQKKWHIVDLEEQNKASILQLTELVETYHLNEIAIAEVEMKIKSLKSGLKNDIIVTREMKKIPAIVEIEKGLVPLYLERSEILKTYTKSSREYISINRQIEILQNEIRSEVKKAIATEELELDLLKVKHASLSRKIDAIRLVADDTRYKEKTLNEFEREVALLHKNYMLYASKKEDALIFSDRKRRNLANVSIADRAKIPPKPSFPKRVLFLIISFILGLFAAIGLPFILEFIDHRIKCPQDVEGILSLPVITSVPAQK